MGDLDEAANRMSIIEDQVTEYTNRLDSAFALVSSSFFVGEIGDGLGTVVINGAGDLVEVNFAPERVCETRAQELSEKLMAALASARAEKFERLRGDLKRAAREIIF
ncbi:YbaB/EbfC family nucleoid-associated protein [Actinomadura logoneensis]|nr:YbaB/EbfC family nucleoid-associated protein [Actinomadura logoneensis]